MNQPRGEKGILSRIGFWDVRPEARVNSYREPGLETGLTDQGAPTARRITVDSLPSSLLVLLKESKEYEEQVFSSVFSPGPTLCDSD